MSNNRTRVDNIGRDVTDSSQNYAFVLFKRKEEAAAAKEAYIEKRILVGGQPIKIEFAGSARIDHLSFFLLFYLYFCRVIPSVDMRNKQFEMKIATYPWFCRAGLGPALMEHFINLNFIYFLLWWKLMPRHFLSHLLVGCHHTYKIVPLNEFKSTGSQDK